MVDRRSSSNDINMSIYFCYQSNRLTGSFYFAFENLSLIGGTIYNNVFTCNHDGVLIAFSTLHDIIENALLFQYLYIKYRYFNFCSEHTSPTQQPRITFVAGIMISDT